MKRLLLFLTVMNVLSLQAAFDDWFYSRALRIDYFHSGNRNTELYAIDALISEPFWGGSMVNLADTFGMGKYFFKAIDVESNTLIYSRGYSSLFAEWQFTEEAKYTFRSFPESVQMPFPRRDTKLEFYSRKSDGLFEKVFEYKVDVKSYFINTEQRYSFPVYVALENGDPSTKVDIVLLPEGYTSAEMEQFKLDCDKFLEGLFSFSPLKENKGNFNVRGILAPSEESGTDIPGSLIRRKTIMNSGFYTFDSERYLMTYDNKSVRDLASNAPYDQIYILVNSSKYGGGAIYNLYSMSVNSNASSAKIFVHEFGHGFAGLGDEYDDGSTSFNDIYNLSTEPWEPNITTLVDFDIKWKKMLAVDQPVPTSLNSEEPLKLGVYEGAGYVAKGVYRPATDCLMRSFKGNAFCGVCSKSIQEMIDFYCR